MKAANFKNVRISESSKGNFGEMLLRDLKNHCDNSDTAKEYFILAKQWALPNVGKIEEYIQEKFPNALLLCKVAS